MNSRNLGPPRRGGKPVKGWSIEEVIEVWDDLEPWPWAVHEVVLKHSDSGRIIRVKVTCYYFSGVSRDYGDLKEIRYEPRCPWGCRKGLDKMIEEAFEEARLVGVLC